MGWAARANHRSTEGGKRFAAVQRARLARIVGQLRTQDQYDVFLGSFPEHLQAGVANVVKPMLPALLPSVQMVEVYPVDPSSDGSWVQVKACSHRVIRPMDCGCFAVGYGYSIEHAGERATQAAAGHQHA